MVTEKDLDMMIHDLRAPVTMQKMLIDQVRDLNSCERIESLIQRVLPIINQKIIDAYDSAVVFKEEFSLKQAETGTGSGFSDKRPDNSDSV